MLESFWDCYWTGWKKTFVFQGSASRKEFWSFVLGNTLFLVAIIAAIIWWFLSQRDGFGAFLVIEFFFPPGFLILFLVLLLPTLAVGIRRMHDIGYSEWWFGGMMILNTLLVLTVCPVYSFIYLIMLAEKYDISGLLIAFCAVVVVVSIGVSLLCCKPSKRKDYQLPSAVAK